MAASQGLRDVQSDKKNPSKQVDSSFRRIPPNTSNPTQNKLHGHFGELAMNLSGSFTVEKCFNASNLSLREAIACELLAVLTELSKTKQGPYLLRKLDVDRFAAQPDEWRSKQASKQSAYDQFYDAFGSGEAKSFKKDTFLAEIAIHTSHPKELKNMRKEIDHCLVSAAPSLGTSGLKRSPEKTEQSSEKYAKHTMVRMLRTSIRGSQVNPT